MNLSQYELINVMSIKKQCPCIPRKHKPFWELIILAYFAVSRNANLFVHEKLTRRLTTTFPGTFRKKNFVRKKDLQLLVETSPNKL